MLGDPTFGFPNYLADALMVEQSRHASSTDLDTDSRANDHRLGMIDVDLLTAHETDTKRAERPPPRIGLKRFVKMFRSHL
jgi:hypothetical protein